jgi:hypothetical protein
MYIIGKPTGMLVTGYIARSMKLRIDQETIRGFRCQAGLIARGIFQYLFHRPLYSVPASAFVSP